MLKFPLWKKAAVWLTLLASILVALPTIMSAEYRDKIPDFIPHKPINLGLDLQGGSHLVLEVDIPAALVRAYENLEDEARDILRRDQGGRILFRDMRSAPDKGVSFTVFEASQQQRAADALRKALPNDITITRDGDTFNLSFRPESLNDLREHALEQTLEILRMRVDEFGVSEPLIQREGENRIIIELPGISDVERAKRVIGRTAQLTFHLVDETAEANGQGFRRPPPGSAIFYEKSSNGEPGRPYVLKKRPALTGDNLAKADASFDQFGNPAVTIGFDATGTRKFATLTTDNVGKRMAIVLDGVVYSAPVLREPILGGRAEISGSFTVQETRDLAMILRAGALPAPVKIAEERTIGPSLGQDSIDAGRIAVVLGFVAVLVLMVVFYQWWGMAANVALFFNVVLIIAIMTLLGATMTLPGIAGIVLTIGMAVDANVLIFERIREEAQRGMTPMVAMETGFKSAYGTIWDANLTTLIAAVVLFGMGSGPIKGFALTLSVGILSSMFTAILVTRMILVAWLFRKRPRKFA